MKKTLPTTTALLSALLTTVLVGTLLANLATAKTLGQPPVVGPPLAIIVQLPESKVYTEERVSVAFTVEGSRDFGSAMFPPDSYTYLLDGERVRFWPSQVSPNGSYSFVCKATLSGLSEGTHKLSIAVRAAYLWSNLLTGSYNVPASGVSDSVDFTVNAAAPRLSVLSPNPAKTYNSTMLPLNFTVSEPASWLGYSLDGEAPVTITGNTTLSGLSDGTHTIVVQAEDTTGSTGASSPVTFKVETHTVGQPTEPQSASFPLPLAVVTAVALLAGATLIAYFRKHKR
jgi:hypothetical protein